VRGASFSLLVLLWSVEGVEEVEEGVLKMRSGG